MFNNNLIEELITFGWAKNPPKFHLGSRQKSGGAVVDEVLMVGGGGDAAVVRGDAPLR